MRTANGLGLAWVTVWDTPVDAAEFVDALGQATQKRYRSKAPTLAAGGARTYSSGARTVVVTAREIGGKNVVLVVDVPTGVSPQLLDLGRVTIGG